MPCKDSSSQMVMTIDGDERLVDLSFAKITCGKTIGSGGQSLKAFVGKPLAEIYRQRFEDLVASVGAIDPQEQFFLYLEWDALRGAISQYTGMNDSFDPDHYQITSVDHDGDRTIVKLTISPPESMPKILPCSLADAIAAQKEGVAN